MNKRSKAEYGNRNPRGILQFLSGFAVIFISIAIGQELTINQSPLVLGGGVRPNVFVMIDDSESMDREFQTDFNSVASFYWVPVSKRTSWGIAGRKPMPPGLMEGYTFGEGSCGGRRITVFVHMFNQDNRSGGGCSIEQSPRAAKIDWRFYSSSQNFLYYDPLIDYEPWSEFPQANFYAARANPIPRTSGYSKKKNLTGFRYAVWHDTLGYEADEKGQPMGPGSVTMGSNGKVDVWDDHIIYTVGSASLTAVNHTHDYDTIKHSVECERYDILSDPPYQDCFGVERESLSAEAVDTYGRSIEETQQNVANWYQYHRRRMFTMKSAIDFLLDQASNYQVSLDVFNSDSKRFYPAPSPDANLEARRAHNLRIKRAFLADNRLVRSTPLRRSLERIGNYYLGDLPGHNSPISSACQQNFAMIFTDGRGNGPPPINSFISDNDKDDAIDTLADVARHYYLRDLSDLENRVPSSSFNPNTHQHMVTFTISFGQTGDLVDTDGDGWPNPPLTEDSRWRLPNNSPIAEAMDDLWHAAYNSRGAYVSARNRLEIIKGLERFIIHIGQGSGSVVPLASSTSSLREGALLFRASFDSEKWSGELDAYEIDSLNRIKSAQKWRASSVLDSQHYSRERTLLTARENETDSISNLHFNTGVAFRFPANFRDPSAEELTEEAALSLVRDAPDSVGEDEADRDERLQDYGQKLVGYLRGSRDEEGADKLFREREHVLGDIVNSKARFVGSGSSSGVVNISPSYVDFLSTIKEREPMLYVGSNDGFLHGFSARTGRELIGYIPAGLLAKAPDLALKNYSHKFFVDGSPTVVDSEITLSSGGEKQWRTVLASGIGAGGRSVFALDITEPAEFSESNADDIVLWEFSEKDDADMGFSYSAPQIVKLENGNWAAVFGNGFASRDPTRQIKGSGQAVLFVLDLSTGNLLRKISTKTGTFDSPNGLATPVLIDANNNGSVDTAYAGDLKGNLWKFDLSDTSPSVWKIEQGTEDNPAPLFVTRVGQPISSQPTVTRHPDALGGVMIYFGTGKFIESADGEINSQPNQSVYGIWDNNRGVTTTIPLSSLLTQNILSQELSGLRSSDGHTVRTVSNRSIDWGTHRGWRLPLVSQTIDGVANSLNFGERQISAPQLRQGRVFFSTFQPQSDSCGSVGRSFLMQLDYRNGGQPQEPVFDLNGDDKFTVEDGLVAGVAQGGGALGAAVLLRSGENISALVSGWEEGVLETPVKSRPTLHGRQSWRQLE